MSLKRIPHEETNGKSASINFTIQRIAEDASGFKKRALEKVKKVREMLQKECDRDEQIIARTVANLAHFLEKEKQYTFEEIDALLDKVQRLMLILQRKKKALLEKKYSGKLAKRSENEKHSKRKRTKRKK